MKPLALAACLAFASAATATGAAAQQASAADDLASRLISNPSPVGFRIDGAPEARVRDDSTVQFGKAVRVPVPGRSEQPWTVGVAVPVVRPVHRGDSLILAFWARLESGENGATTASLPYNAVQLAAAPYTAVFNGPATINREWKLYEVRGRADRDYTAGQLNIALHLATGRQTIDIGPVFLLNMGQ